LLEPGASAGLNLLVDRFRIGGDAHGGWWTGPAGSPLVLAAAVLGQAEPIDYDVVERRGCDLEPVDASTAAGRLRLTSFVWPHQTERHARLRAALEIADAHPVVIDRSGASAWLADQLASEPDADVLTVVWHSVTRLYWPTTEVDRVQDLINVAGNRMPLAHVAMEYPAAESGHRAELTVDLHLPGEHRDPVTLATVDRHGGPTRLATVADHGLPVKSLSSARSGRSTNPG
jgi:hypothetical protein